jgi:hypothetical protein
VLLLPLTNFLRLPGGCAMSVDSASIVVDPLGGQAPAFDAHEKTLIAAWATTIARYGLGAGITSAHQFLAEALQVTPVDAAEPSWLVHKTPRGGFAVRLWPGVAEIFPTLAEALAVITASAEQAAAGHATQPPGRGAATSGGRFGRN